MNKKSKKTSKAEPANKTRLLLKLQKMEAYHEESAKTLRELGFTDKKKFERHIDLLESEGKIKKRGKPENYKYWLVKNKLNPKKKKGSQTFFIIWIAGTFVLLFAFILLF